MKLKIRNIAELMELIPTVEWMVVDVLRSLVKERLGPSVKEKISFNVPYFYNHKGIVIDKLAMKMGIIQEVKLKAKWISMPTLKKTKSLIIHIAFHPSEIFSHQIVFKN